MADQQQLGNIQYYTQQLHDDKDKYTGFNTAHSFFKNLDRHDTRSGQSRDSRGNYRAGSNRRSSGSKRRGGSRRRHGGSRRRHGGSRRRH